MLFIFGVFLKLLLTLVVSVLCGTAAVFSKSVKEVCVRAVAALALVAGIWWVI